MQRITVSGTRYGATRVDNDLLSGGLGSHPRTLKGSDDIMALAGSILMLRNVDGAVAPAPLSRLWTSNLVGSYQINADTQGNLRVQWSNGGGPGIVTAFAEYPFLSLTDLVSDLPLAFAKFAVGRYVAAPSAIRAAQGFEIVKLGVLTAWLGPPIVESACFAIVFDPINPGLLAIQLTNAVLAGG